MVRKLREPAGQSQPTVNLSIFGFIRVARQHSLPPANRDDPAA
jgi:hypothetical protein